jgi:nucleoside-diphosphate-sugar epimerase
VTGNNKVHFLGKQALAVLLSPDPNAVTPKAVAGTLNALRAASKQSLKRFVLTSSSAAALLSRRGTLVQPYMVQEDCSAV